MIFSKPETNGNQSESCMKLGSLLVPVLRNDLNLAACQKLVQFVQEFKPNTNCYHFQSSGKENALNADLVKDIPLSSPVLSYCRQFTFPKEAV